MIFALNFIHLDLDKLGWMMAAMSVGIGFGLRDIISNFFSGLILLFERPLRVGDIIKVGDVLGEVKRIKIRSTVVTSFDNIDIIVPNKDFITSEITNWTSSDRDMRSTLGVGVNYGADLEKVREVLLETVSKHGRVYKDPAPVIYISSFGDSSIDFAVVYWTLLDFKRGTFSDLHFAIDAAFKREGIEIPFPQRDINFKVEEMPVFLTAPKDELLEATAGPKKEKDPDFAEPGSDEGDRGSGGGDEDL